MLSLALGVGKLPLFETQLRMRTFKFNLIEGNVRYNVVDSTSFDFNHFSCLSLVEFTIVVGPNVNFLSMSTVSLSGEATSIIGIAASGHFIDVLPKSRASSHVLVCFAGADFVC